MKYAAALLLLFCSNARADYMLAGTYEFFNNGAGPFTAQFRYRGVLSPQVTLSGIGDTEIVPATAGDPFLAQLALGTDSTLVYTIVNGVAESNTPRLWFLQSAWSDSRLSGWPRYYRWNIPGGYLNDPTFPLISVWGSVHAQGVPEPKLLALLLVVPLLHRKRKRCCT